VRAGTVFEPAGDVGSAPPVAVLLYEPTGFASTAAFDDLHHAPLQDCRMEAFGHLFDASQAKPLTAARSVEDLCRRAVPAESRKQLLSLLMETVVMGQGRLPEALAHALWLTFNEQHRVLTETDTQWLLYGLRKAARCPQLPTAKVSSSYEKRCWTFYDSGYVDFPADRFELLCNVAAAAMHANVFHETAILDTMIAVLCDAVPVSRKVSVLRALFHLAHPLPDQVFAALARATPMPPVGPMPTAEQIAISDAWRTVAQYRNPSLADVVIERCLVG
jgi:hypothetical protein